MMQTCEWCKHDANMYICELSVIKLSLAPFLHSVCLPVLFQVLTHLTTQRLVCGFFARRQACRQRQRRQDRQNLGRIDRRMPVDPDWALETVSFFISFLFPCLCVTCAIVSIARTREFVWINIWKKKVSIIKFLWECPGDQPLDNVIFVEYMYARKK